MFHVCRGWARSGLRRRCASLRLFTLSYSSTLIHRPCGPSLRCRCLLSVVPLRYQNCYCLYAFVVIINIVILFLINVVTVVLVGILFFSSSSRSLHVDENMDKCNSRMSFFQQNMNVQSKCITVAQLCRQEAMHMGHMVGKPQGLLNLMKKLPLRRIRLGSQSQRILHGAV